MKMATNLALDDKLIRQAQKAGGHRTKRAAVTAALEEEIEPCTISTDFIPFGTVDYEEGYDHKEGRHR